MTVVAEISASAMSYQSDVDKQANQVRAMDNLERKLRTTLKDSAANSTLGRDKIEQIINQVKTALQAMAPIANTPMGQPGVLKTPSTPEPSKRSQRTTSTISTPADPPTSSRHICWPPGAGTSMKMVPDADAVSSKRSAITAPQFA
ncbi:DUF4226 domain-containing protein [Mycobacterium marinum]|uniref:DUF4226 domain-containing protein n=1 Tax=Mycobacterium marinum TaxID=1781 RepID=UPI003565B333